MKKWSSQIFAIILAGAIFYSVRGLFLELDWNEAWQATRTTPLRLLLIGIPLTLLSYSIFATYDWLGLRKENNKQVHHLRVLLAAFVCYAGNFNFGSLIGGMGLRYSIYGAMGFTKETITKTLTLSTWSNWSAYGIFFGIIFLCFTVDIPAQYGLDVVPWKFAALLAIGLGLVFLITAGRKIPLPSRFDDMDLPNFQECLLRLGLALLNWCVISAILVTLFSHWEVDPVIVIAAYLTASIAGLLTHIPAGVGVLEAVFLAFLSSKIGANQVIASLLVFRLIYYILPLTLGVACYLGLKSTKNKEPAA